MSWPCFWTERNGRAVVSLRRFTFSSKDEELCPGGAYYGHNASVVLGTRKLKVDAEGYIHFLPVRYYRRRYADLWPTKCSRCEYRFKKSDQWQVNQEAIHVRPDTGETWTQRDLPIGAMYDGFWARFGVGKDGISLFVTLPKPDPENPGLWVSDHFWHVDGPARNFEGGTKPNAWSRTGDPRKVPCEVDVNPSIATPSYHGYLRNGVLTDPL